MRHAHAKLFYHVRDMPLSRPVAPVAARRGLSGHGDACALSLLIVRIVPPLRAARPAAARRGFFGRIAGRARRGDMARIQFAIAVAHDLLFVGPHMFESCERIGRESASIWLRSASRRG